MRSIPLSIPNTVRPVCPNSDHPNPRYPKQIARNIFLPTHFTPLIQKPRCPTTTQKFMNGYVISTERKRQTGRVKVHFLCTMNLTVADPVGRSYRSLYSFLRVKISF